MTEEEKILKYLNTMKVIDFDKLGFAYAKKTINDVLDLIKKQQSELEKKDKIIAKLKKHNKDLLRKLRNRVKEVKKLIKYSLYKKEFSKLNKQIEKKDKIIDLMAEEMVIPKIKNKVILEIAMSSLEIRKEACKKYFERKVKNEN